MNKIHEIESVKTDDTFLYLTVDGQVYRIEWKACSDKLAGATPEERRFINVSPAGYGLHCPFSTKTLRLTLSCKTPNAWIRCLNSLAIDGISRIVFTMPLLTNQPTLSVQIGGYMKKVARAFSKNGTTSPNISSAAIFKRSEEGYSCSVRSKS